MYGREKTSNLYRKQKNGHSFAAKEILLDFNKIITHLVFHTIILNSFYINFARARVK